MEKVKIVQALRGRGDEGLLKKHAVQEVAKSVFISDKQNDYVFEEFFRKHNIDYVKKELLID